MGEEKDNITKIDEIKFKRKNNYYNYNKELINEISDTEKEKIKDKIIKVLDDFSDTLNKNKDNDNYMEILKNKPYIVNIDEDIICIKSHNPQNVQNKFYDITYRIMYNYNNYENIENVNLIIFKKTNELRKKINLYFHISDENLHEYVLNKIKEIGLFKRREKISNYIDKLCTKHTSINRLLKIKRHRYETQ